MKNRPTPATKPEPFAMTEADVLRVLAARRDGWALSRKV